MKKQIDQLKETHRLTYEEALFLLSGLDEESGHYFLNCARTQSLATFGNRIFMRGLIEFTNYCKNDCYYCGIRRSNEKAERYRLSLEEILACCESGYHLGFRTFVLQGGEDGSYTQGEMIEIIERIREGYPDCAITLSFGEHPKKTYEAFFKAGADRYLLRHETSNPKHYASLHPQNMSLENRKKCLFSLKEIGYQVGSGFMVGSPGQTKEHLAEDLVFLQELSPQMIGIGPFIPHQETKFRQALSGTLQETLYLIAILRLLFPKALLPATTSLGTIDKKGREQGILAGANVVMPNLSPVSVRKKYSLYDNKICTGEEAAECRSCLANRIQSIGYELVVDRGDFDSFPSVE